MDNRINSGASATSEANTLLPKRKYVGGKGMPLYFFVLIFTVLAVLVQSLAVLFGYDASMNVYKHGSILGTASGITVFVLVAIYSALAFLVMRRLRGLKGLPPTSTVNAFISAAGGVFITLSSVVMWLQSRSVGGNVSNVSAMMMIFSIPAAAYFIMSALKGTRQGLLYGLGFFPVLWAVACLLRVYFDVGTAINDPIRVTFQVSFAAIMLSLLFELRTRLGKRGTTVYVIFSGIAVIIGLPSVVSMLILFVIPKTVSAAELLLCIAQLLLCLHILLRLHTNLKYA